LIWCPQKFRQGRHHSIVVCKRYYVREVKKEWTEKFWGLRPKTSLPLAKADFVRIVSEENQYKNERNP
jgi:hypothetical protein